MSRYVDGRSKQSNKNYDNYKRFKARHKESIKRAVDEVIRRRRIEDVAKDDSGIRVKSTKQYRPTYGKKGKTDNILPGNDQFATGDQIVKPSEGGASSGGAGNSSEDAMDDFMFVLSKEEIREIFFKGLALPDFVKKGLKKEMSKEWVTGGYSKEGIPPRLAIKKTMEQSLARRIANKHSKTKSPFLDEVDLRYIRKSKVEKPVKHAVMFCVMDVSGSMMQEMKLIAKKYYILLNMFLTQFYENVDIVFIRYHTQASECDEPTFFYAKDTGGTVTSNAFVLLNDIIKERYNPNETNIYVAQASDGDNWPGDDAPLLSELEKLLPMTQYFTYLQIRNPLYHGLGTTYSNLNAENMKIGHAGHESDIYPVFRELFKRKGI